MNQQSILLQFRAEQKNAVIEKEEKENIYTYESGLWENINQEPLIEKMINGEDLEFGETLISETREGIDRSEGSN